MSVHLVFEKSADSTIKKIVKALSGPHVHTELVITATNPEPPFITRTSYSAYINDVFSSTPEHDFAFSDSTHDFIQIKASIDEIDKIKKTCDTRVQVKTPYNLKDMVLSIVPLRNPTEKDIFSVNTLFCSQAMVLIFRSCLEPTHPVVEALAPYNSRTISPSQLYTALAPVCEKAFHQNIAKKGAAV